MTKTKWHSKLLSLSIAFALVFSLVAMVAPVNTTEAQGYTNMTVDVSADADVHCCCDYFNITAVIENTGEINATAVNATLTIKGNAEIVSPDPMISCGNITPRTSTELVWEVHCTGWDTVAPTKFTVEVTSDTAATVSDYAQVEQESGWLEAFITTPVQDQVVPVCETFPLTFYIKNTGCNNVTSIWAEISTIEGAEIVGSVNPAFKTMYIGPIEAGGQSENKTVSIHCTGVGRAILHVDPIGLDVCSGREIEGDSAVVEIEQVYGVTCNVTDTKIGHNATFTGEASSDAVTPLTYSWTICNATSDVVGTINGGTDPDVYNFTDQFYFEDGCFTAGLYTACVNVTDSSDPTVTVQCTDCPVEFTVYPVLGVTCNVTPEEVVWDVSGTDCFNFTAERVGGLDPGVLGANYTWEWVVTNSTLGIVATNTSANWTWCPTTVGNFTGTVTLMDNSELSNNATCNRTVIVRPPELRVECDAESQHVCHAVNFTAELFGAVPGHSYNWTWEFENTDTHEVVGTAVGQNVTKTFMCIGNYTGTVTVTDVDFGATANCTANVTIIIEAPELYTPGNGVTVGSSIVDFTWEDIGCCNYTLEVWQKDGAQAKVWLVDTGKDAFWSGPIMDDNYKWQVTATDSCNNSAVSELWYFGVQESAIAVTVTSPNGGEVLSANGTAAITWDAAFTDRYSGFASSQDDLLADISYSVDAGSTWTDIATCEPNDGVYAWTVPMVSSDLCLVMVTVSDGAYNDGVDTSDGVFSIEMAAPPVVPVTSIDLAAGWNLVSLPLIPTNSTIESVMAGLNVTLVYYYDATVPQWLFWNGTPASTLTDMVDGLGYWVFMGSPGTLNVVGTEMPVPPCPTCPPPTPPTYDVLAGWNMIGVKSTAPVHHSDYLMSVSGEYSVIYAYNPATGSWMSVYPLEQNGGMMEPGYGFWIWMNSAGTIVP